MSAPRGIVTLHPDYGQKNTGLNCPVNTFAFEDRFTSGEDPELLGGSIYFLPTTYDDSEVIDVKESAAVIQRLIAEAQEPVDKITFNKDALTKEQLQAIKRILYPQLFPPKVINEDLQKKHEEQAYGAARNAINKARTIKEQPNVRIVLKHNVGNPDGTTLTDYQTENVYAPKSLVDKITNSGAYNTMCGGWAIVGGESILQEGEEG